MLERRQFIGGLASICALAGRAASDAADATYAVSILGDTHFDTEPDSVYHAHYRNEGKAAWLWKVQRQEFARNGEMWRERCPRLLAASAKVAAATPSTDFILQLGDIIQGDCDDAATHKKMLEDCIQMLRAPYPKGLPFLTVVGNHDFRGEDAWDAYFDFAEEFLSRELGQRVRYPAFSFRRGPDLWVFCHFEQSELTDIIRLIDADPSARHVFLVTHGPFTPGESTAWNWRLGGGFGAGKFYRQRLMETLLTRHAIILSGHTHQIAHWRIANKLGSYAEFTGNSVWMDDKLATAEPLAATPAQYGDETVARLKDKADRIASYRAEIEPFKRDLKEYFFNRGAGHFRLNVTPTKVTMDFFPGDATVPARTFVLKDVDALSANPPAPESAEVQSR